MMVVMMLVGVFMVVIMVMLMLVDVDLRVLVMMLVGGLVLMFMVMMLMLVVVIMMVVMLVNVEALLLLAVDRDGHVGALDAALEGLLGRHRDAGDVQRVELLQERSGVGMQLQQGGGQHIAGGTHAAVEV